MRNDNRISLCCHSGKPEGFIRNPDFRICGNECNVESDEGADPMDERSVPAVRELFPAFSVRVFQEVAF